MDQLFNQIFFRHTFIKNHIYYFIRYDVNCKTTNTQHYVDVDVMIRNNHLYLLKSKLKRNEYLCSRDNQWITDSSLISNHMDLFIQCHNRFHNQIPIADMAKLCIKSNNWIALKYILQDYVKDFQRNNTFENLVSINKDNIFKCLVFAVKEGDMELVIFVFSVDSKVFDRLETNSKEELLTKAVMSGNVELFKLIRKYFEESFKFFNLRKGFIYHNKLIKILLHCSISSLDMYNFIQKEHGIQFNRTESLQCDILIPLFSKLNTSDTNIIIKSMLPNEPFSSIYANDLVLSTLVAGHYQVYTYVKDQYNFTFKPPTGSYLVLIKNAFDNLDNIKFLVETVGFNYGYEDFKIATNSAEIFNYLYDRRKSSSNGAPIFNDQQKRKITLFFCISNNIQKVLTSEYILFNIYYFTEFVAKISNVQTFKLIYNKYILSTTTPILDQDILEFFNDAILKGRLGTLKYLVNRHKKRFSTLTTTQIIELLSKASHAGSVQILEYLLQETRDRLMSVRVEKKDFEIVNQHDANSLMKMLGKMQLHYMITLIMRNAMAEDRYDCVKFMLSSFPENLVKLENSQSDLPILAKNCNLLMVKLIFNHPPFHKLDFSYILEQADLYSKEIYDYLYEQGVRKK